MNSYIVPFFISLYIDLFPDKLDLSYEKLSIKNSQGGEIYTTFIEEQLDWSYLA